MKEIEELIKVYDDYIKLLTNELDELAVLASVHGWKSKRYEQGKILREKIARMKETK